MLRFLTLVSFVSVFSSAVVAQSPPNKRYPDLPTGGEVVRLGQGWNLKDGYATPYNCLRMTNFDVTEDPQSGPVKMKFRVITSREDFRHLSKYELRSEVRASFLGSRASAMFQRQSTKDYSRNSSSLFVVGSAKYDHSGRYLIAKQQDGTGTRILSDKELRKLRNVNKNTPFEEACGHGYIETIRYGGYAWATIKIDTRDDHDYYSIKNVFQSSVEGKWGSAKVDYDNLSTVVSNQHFEDIGIEYQEDGTGKLFNTKDPDELREFVAAYPERFKAEINSGNSQSGSRISPGLILSVTVREYRWLKEGIRVEIPMFSVDNALTRYYLRLRTLHDEAMAIKLSDDNTLKGFVPEYMNAPRSHDPADVAAALTDEIAYIETVLKGVAEGETGQSSTDMTNCFEKTISRERLVPGREAVIECSGFKINLDDYRFAVYLPPPTTVFSNGLYNAFTVPYYSREQAAATYAYLIFKYRVLDTNTERCDSKHLECISGDHQQQMALWVRCIYGDAKARRVANQLPYECKTPW